jgi:hypothetical protein
MHNQICAMGHTMDPNGIGSMVIMCLLNDTRLGSLRYIDTINPKMNELSGNLISWHSPSYCQCFHDHFG